MSNTEHRVQKSMLFLCISHREKFGEFSPAAAFPRPFIPTSLSGESVSSFLSGHWMFLPKKDSVFHMCPPPPQLVPLKDHHGTADSSSSARCNIANPDPALSIDGTKLAVNPSMHCAVPKACQLAETKPFVRLLNPTDGEVDSK